ncbi:hypothetical protein LCGC14_1997990, partial [marine sediment metagenome]
MGCPSTIILGDNLVFTICSYNLGTLAATDDDTNPTYRVYEEETGTAILSGSFAKLDDGNTTGFYSESIACTTGNGFEVNKTYSIYAEFTVGAVDHAETYNFRIINENVAGPGDYTVTLTIQDTGASALSGVSVWLNTANDRSSAVAGTKVTDDNGQVTFELHYTTYYLFAHRAGYTFNAANFTAASGNVAFTKAIGVATSTGTASNYVDSFLTRNIDMVRLHMEEPVINAKYSDTQIIEQLERSYIHVIGEKNRNAMNPVVAKFDITIASGITAYTLPYTMGSIVTIYEAASQGVRVFYHSRSDYNPLGKRMWVEGNILHLQAAGVLNPSSTLTVEYIPIGTSRLHCGTCTINSAGTIVTLGATPYQGVLDTHVSGYLGDILRILTVSGSTVTGAMLQERPITAYDNSTRAATIGPALNPVPTTDDGSIFYEIAPAIHKGMDAVVGAHAAYVLA